MKIERILAGIKESQNPTPAAVTEKTAAVKADASPREALLSALTNATTTEKVASASAVGPVDDVMKVAAELVASEKDAAVKEAQLLGTAFMDAAIARLDVWQKTAAQMIQNTPVQQAAPAAGFGKFASENGLLVKQAAELGYNQAKQELEKVAADEYNRGWNETVEAIYKTAADEFLKAAAITAEICEAQG